MDSILKEQILRVISAKDIRFSESIQELWSGYGQIQRYKVDGAAINSLIIKHIQLNPSGAHPRGWNSDISHNRKLKSYQIESNWYTDWADSGDASCRLPKLYYAQHSENEIILVLEDLDAAGYPLRIVEPSIEEVQLGLNWLACFHSRLMGVKPKGIWQKGSYWHLSTRADELKIMRDGPLKEMAKEISEQLDNAKYQTIIHGDAKLANFCFSEDKKSIAAVDFQYVGGGCGIKDVAYFLSSCLGSEQLLKKADQLVEYYFDCLEKALVKQFTAIEFASLKKEWLDLYPFAWADFSRFLRGWSPDHWKLHAYSQRMVEKALGELMD